MPARRASCSLPQRQRLSGAAKRQIIATGTRLDEREKQVCACHASSDHRSALTNLLRPYVHHHIDTMVRVAADHTANYRRD